MVGGGGIRVCRELKKEEGKMATPGGVEVFKKIRRFWSKWGRRRKNFGDENLPEENLRFT